MDHQSYLSIAGSRFGRMDALAPAQIAEMLSIHDKEIEFLREERKMHFGAMSLVAVLAFLALNGAWLTGSLRPVNLVLMALLLALEIPYVFVYYRMENKLRRMNREYFQIRDALVRSRSAVPAA